VINKLTKTCLLTLAGISAIGAQAAQNINPKLDWQIFETEHFRIHYTPEYRDWMLVAANEMEASRKLLIEQQNRKLQPKVDVVVFDPLNDSNGYAISFSTKPFMALYATPPLSDSMINNSTSWQQLLALHEYVHLLHLAQPERSNWRQKIKEFIDLYDVLSNSMDRWVAEGYATLLESKLTGRGRLYDAQVEAMIQQFAREGALPTYGQLNQTQGKYRIGSMAYLVGVRYLQWLEENYSEQTLDAVWTRMKGVKKRSFEEAFKGVFRQPPEYLYQRFVAEYTQKVMNAERQLKEERLWLDADFELTAPSLSPDQSKVVVIEKSDRDEGKVFLNVFETKVNEEAINKFEKANKELLTEDPVDIADVMPLVFNPKRIHQLGQINNKGIKFPRWRNNDEIIYVAKTQDADGSLHHDLFMWQLSTDKVIQLSAGLNIRRFDVSPDGKTLIAERNLYGQSSLVQLSLDSKIDESSVKTLSHGNYSKTFDFPKFNPTNSNQIAYLSRQQNQPWQLHVLDLESGQNDTLPMPNQYQYLSYVEWANDGESVYFVAGKDGKLKVYQYEFGSQALYQVTSGQAPIAYPMEFGKTGTKELLYSSFRSRGPNLYVSPLNSEQRQLVTNLSNLTDWQYLEENSKSGFKMPGALAAPKHVEGVERPYGSGLAQQDMSVVFSGTATSASTNLLQVAVKGGDLLQKSSWLVNLGGDLFNDSASGFNMYADWRAWPVDVSGAFYYFDLDPSLQASKVNSVQGEFAGFNLTFSKDYGFYDSWLETYRGEIALTVSHNERQLLEFAVEEQQTYLLNHKQSWSFDNQDWGIYQFSDISLLQGKSDVAFLPEEDSWSGHQARLGLAGKWLNFKLGVEHEWAIREDHKYNFLRMGGIESTLINKKNLPNWVFIPELPFGSFTGDEYKRTTLSLRRLNGMEFYYSDLELGGSLQYDIVGLKNDFKIDFVRAGLTDLHVDYGFASVIDVHNESELQAWVTMRYQY